MWLILRLWFVAMTVAPENTVHVIGDADPILRCSIEFESQADDLIWTEYTTYSNRRTFAVGDGGVLSGLEDKYYLEGTNLGIHNASLSSAGKYECGNVLVPTVHATAELLVLGRHPHNI